MGCELNKCCFCINLRTGCLIIGYVNLVIEIIAIAIALVFLAGSAMITADKDHQDAQALGLALTIVLVILLLLLFFFLAFTIVLLVGVHKNKRGHVKAYMIYTMIFLVLGVIIFFVGVANGGTQASNIVSSIFSFLLNLYFWLVIRSYYLKMGDKRPAIYNTA